MMNVILLIRYASIVQVLGGYFQQVTGVTINPDLALIIFDTTETMNTLKVKAVYLSMA